jgi:XTP/dITP diphosphohydrolase
VLTYVATTNAGKLHELRAIFAGSALELAIYPEYAEVAEGQTSYDENAERKVRGLQAQLQSAGIEAAVLADDSGLEVDALDGAPGVISARFGGSGLTWPQRRAYLLAAVAGVPEAARGARFVSSLALLHADGRLLLAAGAIEGTIAREERGDGGFGYDPLFVLPDGRTFAQLSDNEKNAISHRRRAADALIAALRPGG